MTRYEQHLLHIISELLAADAAKSEAEHSFNYSGSGGSLEDLYKRANLQREMIKAGDRFAKAKMAAAQEIIENAGSMTA